MEPAVRLATFFLEANIRDTPGGGRETSLEMLVPFYTRTNKI